MTVENAVPCPERRPFLRLRISANTGFTDELVRRNGRGSGHGKAGTSSNAPNLCPSSLPYGGQDKFVHGRIEILLSVPPRAINA